MELFQPQQHIRNSKSQKAASAQALTDLIKELLSLITQNTNSQTLAIMAEAEITLPQIVTLQALSVSGPRNISSIARLLNLSRPATSHLVDRLVSMHLVDRSEDTRDRREKLIQITSSGTKLMDRLIQSRGTEFEAAMEGLPEQLRIELAGVLENVIERLRQGQERPPDKENS